MLSLQFLQPLLFEHFQLNVVPVYHDILVLLISQFPSEPIIDSVVAELKSALLHHLVDLGYHPNALLILDTLQTDVVSWGLKVYARRIEMDV